MTVATPPAWAPTLADVALILPAYTTGGYDDDGEDAGAEQGTFTASTSPTAVDVEALIAAACDEVAGRVGTTIPARHAALAGITAKYHVAMSVSGGKAPARTEDQRGEYAGHVAAFRGCLDALIALCRMGGSRLR